MLSRSKLVILFSVATLVAQSGFSIKKDNAQVQEDESVKINVLKNDLIDDKSNLILEISSEPQMGSVRVEDNKVIYTPNPNVNGIDKFEYKVDIGTISGTGFVRVNISPVNDPPISLVLSNNEINENAPKGTLIGKLQVEDPDDGDKFKFGVARDNKEDFSLEGSSLITKRSFDFEEEQSFSVTIQVTDSGDETLVETINVNVKNQNESPMVNGDKNLVFNHPENAGKIVGRLNISDPDANQSHVKYKINNSDDKDYFKITRSGDIAFLRDPDFENPEDKNKDNTYKIEYKALDSKDNKLFVSGSATINVIDAEETEVVALDKRKYTSWKVDHQPYHILMEDAVLNYIKLNYADAENGEATEDGYGTVIKEMKPTDQIIIVQAKGNTDELHEIWYGNGLDFTIIDREKVDWIFSQDIQSVLIAKEDYLTSDSEVVFHESEKDRLMAGYGSQFSVWHANNFKMSLSSLSFRSNLLQYASNFRVGNALIGLPGLLSGSSELGVATQRSEFGLRVPFAFDFGTRYKDEIKTASDEYLGLYARGNIDNLFATKTSLHALAGFTFYPSSSGNVLNSLRDISDSVSVTDISGWDYIVDNTQNINILDSYALIATSVKVPARFSFIGRLTASPGFHYIKIAHRLKDTRPSETKTNTELYDRTFYNQSINQTIADSTNASTVEFTETPLNDERNPFTRLNSFYIRFDLVGQIGQKPRFVERLSFLDFIQVSKVPFYEFSVQYISNLNTLFNLNLNISDDFGISFTTLSKNPSLSGEWMPESKVWFGLNYRSNF